MNSKKILFLLISIPIIILSFYIFIKRHTLLAVIYQTIQLEDKAIESFYEANDAYSYYQLGLIYKSKGLFDKAERVYLQLLTMQHDHPHANYDLGYVYREMKLYDKALVQYQQALKIDPLNTYALSDIAYIFKEKGEYKKALEMYDKVLEIDPSQKYALWDIAVVYEKLGMKERAEEQYKYYHKMTDCSFRRFWNCFD